jgi:hypothetical protein
MREDNMATVEKAHDVAAPAAKPETGAPTNQAEAKKAINRFEGELDEHKLTRAASEYMVALRPQPSRDAMSEVLVKIAERDEKGELKHKCKSTDEVPALVDAALKG